MNSKNISVFFLILVFFSIIGSYIGFLRPLKSHVVFVYLNDKYREEIISKINDNPAFLDDEAVLTKRILDHSQEDLIKESQGYSGKYPLKAVIPNGSTKEKVLDKRLTKNFSNTQDNTYTTKSLPSLSSISEDLMKREEKKTKDKKAHEGKVWKFLKGIFVSDDKKKQTSHKVKKPSVINKEEAQKEDDNSVVIDHKSTDKLNKIDTKNLKVNNSTKPEEIKKETPEENKTEPVKIKKIKPQNPDGSKKQDSYGDIDLPSLNVLSKDLLKLDK